MNCDIDYNECQSNPCRNNGFCVDKEDEYECHCGMGYTGRDCSLKVWVHWEGLLPQGMGTLGGTAPSRYGYTGRDCSLKVRVDETKHGFLE